MNFDKALFFAIGHGTVVLFKVIGKGVNGNALLFGLIVIETHMGDLRVGVGTPGDMEAA